LLALLLFLLAACSRNTPEAVARGFVEAMTAGDAEGVLKLLPKAATSDPQDPQRASRLRAFVQSRKNEGEQVLRMDTKEVKVEGDRATVDLNVWFVLNRGTAREKRHSENVHVLLVRQDGRWTVSPEMFY
jgi:ketosteroid isomerase-like protein